VRKLPNDFSKKGIGFPSIKPTKSSPGTTRNTPGRWSRTWSGSLEERTKGTLNARKIPDAWNIQNRRLDIRTQVAGGQ
jgi:hypothetical protein